MSGPMFVAWISGLSAERRSRVVGQLFFDASHATGALRGRRNQKAPSAWEIHPIVHIEFAPIPQALEALPTVY